MTTELNLILYLHIIAAMALVGGVVAHYAVHLRVKNSTDVTDLRSSMAGLRLLEKRLIIPAGGIVGLLGIILAWRYDAKGILSFADERWLHYSIVLWIVANVIGVLEGRTLEKAYQLGDAGEPDTGAIRARLNSGRYLALATVNLVVLLILLYLMIFQP